MRSSTFTMGIVTAVALATASGSGNRVTVPAGTRLSIVLDTSVGSDISRVEDPVTGHLAEPIVVDGKTVADVGSEVAGVVTEATLAAKVKGLSRVTVRFDAITPSGDDDRYGIQTAAVGRTGEATKEKDAIEIAGPAAGGAILGALVGGKKGAAIGTAVGGGAGTAVVLSTRGQEVRLARGSAVAVRLEAPVTVRVKS